MKYVCILLILCITGCATIVSGPNQSIPVTTQPSQATITVNGMKYTTPCTLTLSRSLPTQYITIEKEGYEPITYTLTKTVNGWVWGNILFGGWIGLIVDFSTRNATAFTPESVNVSLVKKLEAKVMNKDLLVVDVK